MRFWKKEYAILVTSLFLMAPQQAASQNFGPEIAVIVSCTIIRVCHEDQCNQTSGHGKISLMHTLSPAGYLIEERKGRFARLGFFQSKEAVSKVFAAKEYKREYQSLIIPSSTLSERNAVDLHKVYGRFPNTHLSETYTTMICGEIF